ncbi:hypothetical protein [Intestinimonas butyriciproducens]|uniref:hypothetical protein n=2 Tax=Intestinimonas butyriciproducens TaxID=1297617 RepID=UPI00242B7AE5|nr:hypothetical protein [Intestinimonas butyriciproducens]MCI6361992.1 hypothetical protein [Intestinimonas butyriciproducens]MDY3615220.1 hypothetical protein [Intestinimonas butyriciproducens]
MKNEKKELYVKIVPEKNEIVCSGLSFDDFICYLPEPIENLINIAIDTCVEVSETNYKKGFPLFEGKAAIKKIAEQESYCFGNFCFVDYCSSEQVDQITAQEISELLYLGHMFEPLHSPFFPQLQNRFAYLSHDDSWYWKLYAQNIDDFLYILCGRLAKCIELPLPDNTQMIHEQLLYKAREGILIDLNEAVCKNNGIDVRLYTIGEYANMDKILNYLSQIKKEANKTNWIHFRGKEWSIS